MATVESAAHPLPYPCSHAHTFLRAHTAHVRSRDNCAHAHCKLTLLAMSMSQSEPVAGKVHQNQMWQS